MTPMDLAFAEAHAAAARGEIPVGAIVVDAEGSVLASAGNQTEADDDPTAHAEIVALRRAASRLGNPRLAGCDLFVTLEPCSMCAHAISLFRIRRLVFAAYDPKGGGVDHGPRIFSASSCHHRPEVIGGVREQEATALLRSFFQRKRHESRSPESRKLPRREAKEKTMDYGTAPSQSEYGAL